MFQGSKGHMDPYDTEAAEQSKFSVATTCLLCGVSQAFGDSHSGMRLAEWISDGQKKGPFWNGITSWQVRNLKNLQLTQKPESDPQKSAVSADILRVQRFKQ